MAVDRTKLTIVYQAGGYRVYMYQTNDTNAAVLTDGYFDAVYPYTRLNAGDIIHAMVDLDGTPYPYTYVVSVGGSDVTVYAGPVSAAGAVSIADAGSFTAQTTVEGATQEIYQHLKSAQGLIQIPAFAFQRAAGEVLAKFADGASDVPGYCVTAEGLGIRWNNHAAPLGIAAKVLVPPDADITANMVLNISAAKTGATVGDAVTFDVTAFNNVVGALYDADADFGGTSSAMTGDATAKTVQHETLTLALANLAAYPAIMDLTIKPTAGTLGTDDLILFGAWILYKKTLLTS